MTPDKIRALRKRVGMTQAEFGEVLGSAQNAVSEWETGNKTPRVHVAATMYQWRQRLDEMEDDREEEWTQDLLRTAATAGIVAVLLRIFSSR